MNQRLTVVATVLWMAAVAAPPDGGTAAAPVPAGGAADAEGFRLPDGAVARLGSARFRHPAPVLHCAYAPDGRTLATAAADGVHLWDADTGRSAGSPPATPRAESRSPPTGRPSTPSRTTAAARAAFSPDGARLAATTADVRTVLLLDAADGREVARIDRVAAVGQNRFWVLDARTGGVAFAGGFHRWPGPVAAGWRKGRGVTIDGVSAVAFRPDGKTLAPVRPAGRTLAAASPAGPILLWPRAGPLGLVQLGVAHPAGRCGRSGPVSVDGRPTPQPSLSAQPASPANSVRSEPAESSGWGCNGRRQERYDPHIRPRRMRL